VASRILAYRLDVGARLHLVVLRCQGALSQKEQAVAYCNVIDHMHYSLCMDPHLGNNLARLLEPFNLPATPLVVSLPARRLPFHY
jgi:hypothetical protein